MINHDDFYIIILEQKSLKHNHTSSFQALKQFYGSFDLIHHKKFSFHKSIMGQPLESWKTQCFRIHR